MLLFNQTGNSYAAIVAGVITSGNRIALSEAPKEVRVFDVSNRNGNLINWEYSLGECVLARSLSSGETAKCYSHIGLPLFETELFTNNISEMRSNEIEVSFLDTYTIKDFVFSVVNPYSSSVSFYWKTATVSWTAFPIEIGTLAKDTYHEFTLRCDILETVQPTNYRDIDFSLTYRRVGDE